MAACHVKPVLVPGVLVKPLAQEADPAAAAECCDYCGSAALEWRKCKLICSTCAQINKSCADL